MRRMAGLAIVMTLVAGRAAAADPAAAAALAAAAFVTPPMHADEVVGDFAAHTQLANGTPAEWRTGEVRLSAPTATTVDSLRVTLARPDLGPGRLVRLPGAEADPAYEVSLVRHWPAAVSFETRAFGVDVTPHAGLGMSSAGGVAEAGAMVRLSQKLDNAAVRQLGALGIEDGTKLAQGRWYVFAAISGRAVGLNMLRTDGDWNHGGWTTDPSSKLVGDGQLGVGWRKGPMQSSVGFVHRTVKGAHMIFGQGSRPDSMVAFSFQIRARP